jgi:hypothetical protein
VDVKLKSKMKKMKVVVLLAILGVGIAFAACNDPKTCKCTYTVAGIGSVELPPIEIQKGKCSDLEPVTFNLPASISLDCKAI